MLQSEAGELRARLAATAGAEEAKSVLTQQLEADLAAALQRLEDTEAARRLAEGEAQTLREEAGEARASRDQRVAALEEHVLELEAQVCFCDIRCLTAEGQACRSGQMHARLGM
jgi:hypothetical protein